MIRLPILLSGVMAICASASAQRAVVPSTAPLVAPSGGPWSAGEGFRFPGNKEKAELKRRRSLSGIACRAPVGDHRLCLAVFDEGAEARFLTLGAKGYSVDAERVRLFSDDRELDAEGAATDGRFYYITGSHSAKRKNCASNPASRVVLRLAIDPIGGRVKIGGGGLRRDDGRLWAQMGKIEGLRHFVGEQMCLGTESPEEAPSLPGRRGVNIEGLAVRDDRLHFGFRGPATNGRTAILSVGAKALFEGGALSPRLSALQLRPGQAVRDMQAVTDGVLILAGPDDDAANARVGWTILRWDGVERASAAITPLAELDLSRVAARPCDAQEAWDRKPEALAVSEHEPGKPYAVVIFSDGLCDGGPLPFTIPRRR